MKIMKDIKLALSVGILAGLWVFFSLSVGSIGGVTLHAWPVFITWGLFFAAGANNQAAVKVATTAIWGPIFGWLCVYFGATILGPINRCPCGIGIVSIRSCCSNSYYDDRYPIFLLWSRSFCMLGRVLCYKL